MQEAYPGAAIVNKIEAGFIEMASDVNYASGAARNAWIVFLALIAYFLITVAAISHQDLLLNNPLKLPVLDVSISLKAFLYFGPLGLLLLHFSLLLQHAMLARKLRELHDRVTRFEGVNLFRTHRVRVQLHSYFYTQLIAGPSRSKFFAFLLRLMTWLTLCVLPVLVLLAFQVTFLPLHDVNATWALRIYLIADIAIMTIFGVFMRFPERGFVAGFGARIAAAPLSFLAMLGTGIALVFFSLGVATIPDERMDVVMTSVWPRQVPQNEGDMRRARFAFAPTVVLFEGEVNYLTGRPSSLFGRNLVVTDTDLVRDAEVKSAEATINLRRRDLRYGVFDRTDMHLADMTGVSGAGASFRETNLRGVKAEKADLQYADLWRAQVGFATGPANTTANLRQISLRNAFMQEADLSGVDFTDATLEGADLQKAQLGSVRWEGTVLKGANLTDAANANADNFAEEQRVGVKGLR